MKIGDPIRSRLGHVPGRIVATADDDGLRLGWRARRPDAHEARAGIFRLEVTDQRDRGAGWCWHIGIDPEAINGPYANADEIQREGGLDSEIAAKLAAEAWVRAAARGVGDALAEATNKPAPGHVIVAWDGGPASAAALDTIEPDPTR